MNNIPTNLSVASMLPNDPKGWVKNKTELVSLGASNHKAFIYYEGLRVYCAENKEIFEWREELIPGETGGLVVTSFTYPTGLNINNVDYGDRVFNFFKVLTPEDIAGGLQTYQVANIPGLGQGVYFNTTTPALNTKQFNFKRFRSNNLSITSTDDEILIETPMTATIPALYVNNLYQPTYQEWLTENALQNSGTAVLGFIFRGKGTLAQPFTDSVVYPLAGGSPTTTPNTAIQNALDGDTTYDITYSYVGTGTRLSPQRTGQQIIVQNNNFAYTFPGDFNYENLNIRLSVSVVATTTGYLIDMDNASCFNPENGRFLITIDANQLLELTNCLGFRNSGNTSTTPPMYDSGRIGSIYGDGTLFSSYSGPNILSRYLFTGDGGNNDNNLHFQIKCLVRADQQGIYFTKNLMRIDFYNALQSGVLLGSGNINLKAFHMTGGQIRFYEKGGITCQNGVTGRLYGVTFAPEDDGIGYCIFQLNSAQVSGSAEGYFAKLNNEHVSFLAFNSPSGNGFATTAPGSPTVINGLFENLGVDRWNIEFRNNVFSYTGINQTKVDLTGGNGTSVINFIGNEIIENLVMFPSKSAAIAAGHVANSAFLKVENVDADDLQSGIEYKITTVGSPSLGTLGSYFIATGTETGTGVGTLYTREVII